MSVTRGVNKKAINFGCRCLRGGYLRRRSISAARMSGSGSGSVAARRSSARATPSVSAPPGGGGVPAWLSVLVGRGERSGTPRRGGSGTSLVGLTGAALVGLTGASDGGSVGSASIPGSDDAEGRRSASFGVVAWGGTEAAASGEAGT